MKNTAQKGFSILEVLLVVVVLGIVGAVGWKLSHTQKLHQVINKTKVDTDHPAQMVTANFIDLSKIFSISKFRSLQGHDFSQGGETCRSMKHYITPQRTLEGNRAVDTNHGIPPKPDGKTDIDIFSPFNGKIVRIDAERFPVGEQIFLVPDAEPGYTVRIFHVYKTDDIRVGTHVTAGQKIGVISSYSDTDISVEAGGKYLSIFQVMTDKVFAEYQARGVKTRDDLIISREYRDAHAVTCNQARDSDQKFNLPANYDEEADQVRLSGYVAAEKPQTGNNGFQNNNN